MHYVFKNVFKIMCIKRNDNYKKCLNKDLVKQFASTY